MSEDNASGSSELSRQNNDVVAALKKVRTFSMLSIAGNAVDLAAFVIVVLSIGVILKDISSTSKLLESAGLAIFSASFLSIGASVLMLVSFVYLRSGYGLLKKSSERFNSPYTGVNLFFAGLILIVVAVLLVLGGAMANSLGLILVGAAIMIVAGIMILVGEILGLILGSFRMRDYFNDSTFSTAGIMFIIGIFFALFSFIGAILVYLGTNSAIKRIQQPVSAHS
ncbi:MAG: DUF973 family protein [Thermoplasmata archaeon]